jgi:predicted esterase
VNAAVRRLILVPFLIGGFLACGDDDGDNGATNNGGTNNGGTNNGGTNNGATKAYPDGEFAVGLFAAPLSTVLPFKFDVVSQDNGDGTGSFQSLVLSAVSGDSVSDPIGTSVDVAIDADGVFTAPFGDITLPAEYSPTSSEVVLNLTVSGTVESAEFFCGEVLGEVVTFEIPLDGSTFAAIPWADRADGIRGSCDDDGMQEIPRLAAEECPELTGGQNNGFPSGGVERAFEVILPEDITDAETLGLAVLYHGRGGDPQGLIEGTPLPGLATEHRFIFVVPQGLDQGGSDGWDVLNTESVDIALFDDIVTCVGNSWVVDPVRIHVAGLSNGGLFTATLSSVRADVLAAVAPASGGLFTPYSFPDTKVPAMVVWGGVEDAALDTNFALLSMELIDNYVENEQFVVACNHNLGHRLDPDMWSWIVRFLADHAGRDTPYPEALPEGLYPEFCEIRR